jgi:uncharacterized protein YrrD
MTLLMKATEIIKRPVVTLGGEDVAQIRDVVYDDDGIVAGFTLAGRGIFAGPRKDALEWSAVLALGPDAVMIRDADVFVERATVVDRQSRKNNGSGGLVLGSRVITDGGTDLGAVTDVVLEVGASAVVRGYQIDPSDALGERRHHPLIPLPDTIAVSGEALVVPAAVTDFVVEDLAGFGAAIEAFRTRLHSSPAGASAVTTGPGTTDATGVQA